MKLVLARPTYGPIPQKPDHSLIAAIMHAANHGVTWVGTCVLPDVKLTTIDEVRNRMVGDVLKDIATEGTDAVLWSDSDITWPVDGITRLADHVTAGKDFVTGLYRHKAIDGSPLVGMLDPHQREGKGAVVWMAEWPEDTIAPMDACGFGCTITSTKLLQATGPTWFEFNDWSEDFSFCMKARDAGYQLYVDTGLKCGHVDEREWTIDEYRERWASGQHKDVKSRHSAA